MKFLVALLGSVTVVLMACTRVVGEDTGMARLFQSCDHNADNALNAAEFAGCLMQTARQQSAAGQDISISWNKTWHDAPAKHDWGLTTVHWWGQGPPGAGLQMGSSRSLQYGASRTGEIEFNLDEFIVEIIKVLRSISKADYSRTSAALYSLVSEYELSSSSQVSLILAITAVYEERYDQTLTYIFSVIEDVAGENASVCTGTVTNVASLLEAVIANNSDNFDFYFYRSMAGVIEDFSTLSEENVSAFATLIQAVIQTNSSEFLISLEKIFVIPNISTEAVTALTELNDTFVNGPPSEISVKILAVLNTVFENENISEVAQIFAAVIEAAMGGNFDKVIKQLTLLYAEISCSSTCGNGFQTDTVVAFAAIINAVKEQNNTAAVAQIDLLIGKINSGLSYSEINTLRGIVKKIEDGEFGEAIAEIVEIGTSGCGNSVEVNVEVFVALSSVITFVKESYDANGTVVLIQDILSNPSITISVEIRSALRALITVLVEGTSEEALGVIRAIMTGSSQAFDRTISTQVATEVESSLAAIDRGDLNASISIVKALLRGERGGSDLSIVVKEDLKNTLKALENSIISRAYSLLTVIAAGSRTNSVTSSALAALVVAIHPASPSYSGSVSHSTVALEPLLQDDDLESSFKAKIEAIISDIADGKIEKAMTAMVAAMFGSKYSLTESVLQSLLNAPRLTDSGALDEAANVIEEIFDGMNGDIQLPLILLIHLLREGHKFPALIIISALISEADKFKSE